MTGPHGRAGLAEASLDVRAGEIVGIAGVSGNGQAALASADRRHAARRRRHGRRSFGAPLAAIPRASIAAGIGRIPEDRHHEGIVGSLSIAENLALETLDDPGPALAASCASAPCASAPWLRSRAFDVRCPGPDAADPPPLGRQHPEGDPRPRFGREPRLVLANQPTRGLDVGATAEVHRRLLEARERGVAVVLISEDLDELLALSDRIAVIARGRTFGAARRRERLR